MSLPPDYKPGKMANAKNSRLHSPWVLTIALAIISIFLLAVSLLLWRANSSFSKAWQQEQKQKAHNAPRTAASGASAVETRIFFPRHAHGKGPAALSLAAIPPRLVELQFETPPENPATSLWTISISGPQGEALRQTHLPANNIAGIPTVRAYVDSEGLPPGSYRVALSREAAPNAGYREQWLFTVTR